ncbi:MAG: flagellar basal-body MS-ring/collar protein FliF [Thermodesulfovibrionales bacterium]|nr:flagellar basal-body MS-ring/collar protein FliF [Thermodesulfovibrionales bacterium]
MASLNNIQQWLNSMPLKKKVMLGFILLMTAGSIILFLSWSQRVDYQVLYSNLSDEDSGMIIQKLKEMRVPYRVTPGGIMVPSDRVYSLRLELASQGLPQGGGVGFEIFDKRDFTMTDFVQKLNYQRALQGELSRTIRSLQEVEQCRVHLAIPEKGLFTREEERPKASVFLKLKPGRRLSHSQIQGIVHLVSSSVDGLSPDDVTVVDSRGELLTSPRKDTLISLTQNQIEFQQAVEKELEERVVAILEPVVGRGKVRAKASAQIDFTKTEKTEEIYDPDSQVVRSEQKHIERSSKTSPGGTPGVSSNIPGKTGADLTANSYSEKKSETVNYEINKIMSHTVILPGEIKRLSVVALVDGSYINSEGGGKKYIPRTEEELKKFEAMVKNAVGFVAKRGDDVRVINMPFHEDYIQKEETEEPAREIMPVVITGFRYTLPLLALLLLFLLVIRPILKAILSPPVPVIKELPRTVAELERQMVQQGLSRPDIIEWARNNPQKAAQIIKGWIEER